MARQFVKISPNNEAHSSIIANQISQGLSLVVH